MAAKDRSFIDSLWDFVCSLKLTLFTLIMLAVTSIIGTVVLQKRSDAEYLQIYSEKVFRLFKALDFFDMYNSWWFILLMGLMTINLICCSINRFPRAWKIVAQPVLTPGEGFLKALTSREEFLTKSSLEQSRGQLQGLLEKKFGKVEVSEADGKIFLFSQKGGLGRFGAYVVHASIIVILIGAMMGMIWGTKAAVNIAEGDETTVVYDRDTGQPVDLGFTVKCEDFTIDYYETRRGMPKEYRSLLTVVKDGQEVPGYTKLPVIVNDPMTFEGWTFYQASYGPAGDPVVLVRAKSRATGQELEYELPVGGSADLPDGKGIFRVMPPPQSMQRFGPGVAVQVATDEAKNRPPFMVFKNHPKFEEKRGGAYVFTMIGVDQPQYTGLEVAKDPGVPVVWVGCALMVLGCYVAFFLSHRRLWLVIESVKGKTGVTLGGSAHRNQPAFELFFEDLIKNIRTELNAPAGEAEEV